MKRLLKLTFLLWIPFAIVCLSPLKGISEQKFTLKVTNWFPVGHKQDALLQEWGKDLEKRTQGKVTVKYFAAGTLVPAAQSYDAVVKGIADVGNHVLGYTVGRFPLSQAMDLPIGLSPGAGPTKIANSYYQKFKPKEFDDVKILWFHAMPDGFLHTKSRAVRTLEDVKGLKLRCFGSNAKFVGLIGGVAVAMPMPDVYEALSKGVVDGLLSSSEALEGFRTGEFIKYTTRNLRTAYSSVFVVAMNKKVFSSLPPEIQKIVDDMSVEFAEKYGQMWTDINVSGEKWLAERGVETISLTPEEENKWFDRGSKPLVEEYVKDMKSRGLPGEEVVEFIMEMAKGLK